MTPAVPDLSHHSVGELTSLLSTAAPAQERGEEQDAAESLHLVRARNFLGENVRHTQARALRGSQRRPHAPLGSEERKVFWGERERDHHSSSSSSSLLLVSPPSLKL